MNSNKRKQKFNKPRSGDRLISVNRRARYEYHILKSMEAGITLKGTEIKSIRTARVSIQHSFARITKSEAWLHGMHIPTYEKGNIYNHDPARPRKLLLRKAQIRDLEREIKSSNLTIIPLRLYITRHKAKVEIALAQGKKLHDKRQSIAKRDTDREISRRLKNQTGRI
jgi:SsrA-binding protein